VDRTFVSFPIIDLQRTKEQVLKWADRFNIFCFLDNQEYRMPGHSVECLLGAGARDQVEAHAGGALARLDDFVNRRMDWLFGHLGYGLTKETEPGPQFEASLGTAATPMTTATSMTTADPIGFPDLFFFVPEIVIELSPDSIRIGLFGTDQAAILEQIEAMQIAAPLSQATVGKEVAPEGVAPARMAPERMAPAKMTGRYSKEEYLATVRGLQEHIHRGDCYEINFCQEFFSCPATIDPLQTWFSLSRNSPNPFSAFYKLNHRYLLCASPERYLRRTGNKLLSQPIKGTWPRSGQDGAGDELEKNRLYHSGKDRAENVMVVDLVRNDLSRICLEGTIRVEELYGVYTFPQVHQMISTVSGELPPERGMVDCIRATFPMGSMTGAPKNRVVALIEEVEQGSRGLFSGAVGYMTPDGDFDLNVVIRSIFYNRSNNYLSYQVGSGITFYSDPELEYEECLWKAEGIKKALGI
jgi:para-aminobenzoate synthetase component I